jgi:hypothetical protein
MHRWAAFAFAFGLVFLLAPPKALACACCSDSGYRSESRSALTKYERGMLGQLRFASNPDLYSDDSDESVRGIDAYADELRLTVAEKDGAFTFTFKDKKGVASKLVLPRPKVVDRFVIDPRNDKDPKANGPVLYKEWRFKSVVTGSGIFKRGLGKGGTARLVLQGHGLRCDDAEMFTHWTLTVTGAHAKYTFFGKLAKPAAP